MTASSIRGLREENRVASRSASARSSEAASCTVQAFRGPGFAAAWAGGTGGGAAGSRAAGGATACCAAGGAGGAAAGAGGGTGRAAGSGGGGGAGVSFVSRSWKVSGSGFDGGVVGARSSASRSPARPAATCRTASCLPTFSPSTNTTPSTTSAPTTIDATWRPSRESSNFSRARTRGFGSRIVPPILDVLGEVASFRTLHPVRRAHAEDGEAVREHLLEPPAEEEARGGLPRVGPDDALAGLLALRVVRVERGDGLLEVEGDAVRLVGERRAGEQVREGGDAPDEVLLLRQGERTGGLEVEVRHGVAGLLRLLEDG